MKPRVFSGIQATGVPTIGNFLGAIRHWVADQDRYNNVFCVVDLHALTVPRDPATLQQDTWVQAACLLAAGIDPERSLLFAQSQVPEHAELTWLLNTVTRLGWLNRMTQFKTKVGKARDNENAGLFTYPVLMAADILLYNTNYVPVGEDQKQHVELTRDVAERFNFLFGETFVIPEPVIPQVGARVMALDDPSRKMSKSEPAGAIYLLDSPAEIRKKLSRAVTDSLGAVRFSDEQPGLRNLLSMIQALSGESEGDVEARLAGGGYRGVKEDLADRIIAAIEPLQVRYRELEANPDIVDDTLAQGAERAHEIAAPVLARAQHRMGLRPSRARIRQPSAAL